MGKGSLKKMTLVVTIVMSLAALASAILASSHAKPGCDEWRGEVRIPCPFGMKEGCHFHQNFSITCNTTHYNPPKPFLQRGNVVVTNISISGEIHVMHYIAKDCYTRKGRNWTVADLTLNSFTISDTKNKFTAIGCDTYAYIYGLIDKISYKSGCMSLCQDISTVKDGTCSGNGCCQLEIPKGLKNLRVEVKSSGNHSSVLGFNPCGYAFVIQKDKFKFSSGFICNFTEPKVPVVLDWAIKNTTCKNKMNCICGQQKN